MIGIGIRVRYVWFKESQIWKQKLPEVIGGK